MIILADPRYNPNFINPGEISSETKLAPGVAISKFLGAYGDRTPFTHITTANKRAQIARNLYLHAELYRSINGNADFFNDVRLIVSEGIYRGGPMETIGGDNIKKSDGRIVVYQVIDQKGNINLERTFDIAEFLKDNIFFKSITLEYDTYNPDGGLTAQIVVEMPEVPESFDVQFQREVKTVYNSFLFSSNELVEVLS